MEIRPATTDADLDALVAVRNAVYPFDPIGVPEMRSWESQVKELRAWVAWEHGQPVGAADAVLRAQSPDPFAEIWVVAEKRRRGIGSALYETVSRYLDARGKNALETPIEDSDPAGEDFARNREFIEIGRDIRVSLDLTKIEAPRVEPPSGVSIVTWAERPELIRGIYEVALEAFVDIPGEEDEEVEPFEDWVAHEMEAGPGDRPDATFVAVAGDEVVGYSKFSIAARQSTVAHHDMTGVKRAWRGRGIARALKQAQIAWAKNAGYERLDTRNEERNVPIRKLNAEFGYEPSGIRKLFRGPLTDASDR